jgi:8-oxo-dGTP pyrophosphatase MutT (NUDIX family)
MASRNEVSAGGVVYRQGDNGVEVLICKDAGYRRWVLPKGLVGKGESLEGTALREVEEEVNVKARLVDSLGEEKYVYKARGVVVFKSVYYFLMEYQSGSISPQKPCSGFPLTRRLKPWPTKARKRLSNGRGNN